MKNTFNIISGFNDISVISELKKAGATELYAGFFDKKADRKWPVAFNILNRRGEDANFTDWNIFKEAVQEAEEHKLPVHVTFNGLYVESQYKMLLDTIEKVSSLNGVKAVIVNDIALLIMLKNMKYNKDIVISTGGTTFNSQTVKFYKEFGAKRIILDRQLEIKDIIGIIKSDEVLEYEIFGFGGSCFFIDGFCSFFHCSENIDYSDQIVKTYNSGQFCTGCHLIENNIIKNSLKYKRKYDVNPDNFLSNMRHSCNLCFLYALKDIKNISLKIVNRKNSTIKFVEVVKCAVDKLKNCKSKAEYEKYCRKILEDKKIFKCNRSQCFYR